MSYETVRISELAKELGLASKEVVEKFTQMGITGKTHSSTVTLDQIKRLKDFIANGGVKKTTKPKAFVVKKAKAPEPVVEEKKETKPAEKKPLIEKVPRIEKVERPKVEVVKPVSRLEIVRRAPKKTPVTEGSRPERPERGGKRPFNKDDKKFTPRGERPAGERKFSKGEKPTGESKDFAGKKPLQRRIIPQEIYENKSGTPNSNSKRRTDGKKKEKDFNSKKEEQERISLEKAAAQHHKKKVQKVEEIEEVKQIVVNQAMTISELSEKIKRTPAEIVKFLMLNGIMATVNQLIDIDVIKKVCAEYGLEVLEEDLDAYIEQELEKEEKAKALSEVDKKLLKKRAPVISIMGHVDHGKTSILDAIRNTSVTSTEAGGITQAIGAYQVVTPDKQVITFLDTPGHAAFTAMRARGAMSTDIAVLVVAADDGIMPQTIEAINHAKAAGVEIIVAINKMDKEGANPDRVMQQLTEHELVPEEWGGDVICVPVSAKTKMGIDKLLETINLVAEMCELKANPDRSAKGVVIEAKLDKGRGPIATLLVQNGTLNAGDVIVAGTAVGKVRAMVDCQGKKINSAGPSVPVEIMGLDNVPMSGDLFNAVSDEKLARQLVEQRKAEAKEEEFKAFQKVTLDTLFDTLHEGELKDLNIIVKADVQGSVEAVKQSLLKIENDEVRVKIIHGGVGTINESDVMLANASNAIIVGFAVGIDPIAQESANRDGIEIKTYDIIYDAIEDIENAMRGMRAPKYRDVDTGAAEVREVYKISSAGTIAGCVVTSGNIKRGGKIRVMRNDKQIADVDIANLKRFKDEVKEVSSGYECGISLAGFDDIQAGDIFEAYIVEEYRD